MSRQLRLTLLLLSSGLLGCPLDWSKAKPDDAGADASDASDAGMDPPDAGPQGTDEGGPPVSQDGGADDDGGADALLPDGASANADLAKLEVSRGTLFPAFSPEQDEYSIDVGIDVPEISFSPTATVVDAVIEVDGVNTASGSASTPVELKLNEERVVTIKVVTTSSTRQYKVTIRRTLAEQTKLSAEHLDSNDYFGGDPNVGAFAMALRANSVWVGAPGADAPSMQDNGAAYGFARTSGIWQPSKAPRASQPGLQDSTHFGASIAHTGEWIVVGAPDRDLNEVADVGAAHVYEWTGNEWDLKTTLAPSNPLVRQRFGNAVAMDETTIAVGAPATNEDVSGKVYIFRWTGQGWFFSQELSAPGETGDDEFGFAVALEDGVLVVGAPGKDNGSGYPVGQAHVFELIDEEWQHARTIEAASKEYRFGLAVDVSSSRIAIASFSQCFLGCDGVPQARVFSSASPWTELATLSGPGGSDVPVDLVPNNWGTSIAISENVVVVGAAFEAHKATGVNPSYQPGGDPGSPSGAAYVFVESSRGWNLDAYVKPSDPESLFGWAVDVVGSTIAISAPCANENRGAVHIFHTNCAQVAAGATIPGC